MIRRPLRRATLLAIAGLLVFAGTAFADQLLADGDLATPGIQGTKFLGNVPAGAVVTADVQFTLNCVGLNHVDLNQSVVLTKSDLEAVPDDGDIVSVTPVTIGPATSAWAGDGTGCPSPVPSMTEPTLSHVTLRAPTSLLFHTFTVVYDRTLSPVGNLDGSTFSRTATQVSFTMNVIPNTPPALTVPASHQEEGNTTGGWMADWSAVSATDLEDNPDPTPTCDPAAGTVFLVGTTTHVSCSVADRSDARVSGEFDVTVVDTTDPVLHDVPGDVSVTTGDPTGRIVTYAAPTATDIVDSSPAVGCLPLSGSKFTVGATTVNCTATDSSGNTADVSFTVNVALVDTTPPTIANVPPDQWLTTGDPSGVVATYATPTASDAVDPSPGVLCLPPSGSKFSVGTTTVHCTATDASGNTAEASFTVNVTFVAEHTASAIWLEPVGASGDAFEANHSRTIPVKVRLFVDGVERSSGHAQLTLAPCGGGSTAPTLPLVWSGGRWNAALDTSMLDGSCYTVTASIDGLTAGAFRLELRGTVTTARNRGTSVPAPTPATVPKKGGPKPR